MLTSGTYSYERQIGVLAADPFQATKRLVVTFLVPSCAIAVRSCEAQSLGHRPKSNPSNISINYI